MKKLICLLFVFTLLSCSSGDDDVVETPANLELTGGWVSQLNTNLYGGIEFGDSSNSVTPMYYTRYDDATCATLEGNFTISKRTPTSLTLSGDDTEFILTVIDSSTLSLSGTSDGISLSGTLTAYAIVKC
tara:strand:- start:1679 stop:2068 length:390 start_codon:yes stop_codon:yes gene_type:complete